MGQVLFWIPIKTSATPHGVPVYGFGLMLFLAFILAAWVAGRLATRAGMSREKIQDLGMWIFLAGLVGGRVVYVWQYPVKDWVEFFYIWQGGIVFYGGAIGGTIGCILAYRYVMRPLGVSFWQVADVFAPTVAVGLCLGRLGCFLNGCCFGQVAPPDAECFLQAVRFPAVTAPAQSWLVTENGWQTLAGFVYEDAASDTRTVAAVEPGSPAERAGLKPGDVIVGVEDTEIASAVDFFRRVEGADWPRGKGDLKLTVQRAGETINLPPFVPRSLGLIPTQLYEAISAALLFFVLVSLYPLRKYDGQVLVWLLVAYSVHRFIVEMIRVEPTYRFGLTLSQYISVGLFAIGGVLAMVLRRIPRVRNAVESAPARQT